MSMRRPAHARRQASVDYPKYSPLNSTTQQPPAQTELMPPQTILASDYESDNQGYTSEYPGPAPPLTRTLEELNLSVLQKWNPDITAILSVAPYATIYDFASATNEWQKGSIVGSLFICQLSPGGYGEDRFRAIVLNRGGLENFEAELRQSDSSGVAIQGDFVEVMRIDPETQETKVNAIYIYSEEGTSTEHSRSVNGQLMVELADAAQRSREAAEIQISSVPVHLHLSEPEEPPSDFEYRPEPWRAAPSSHPSPAPPIAPIPTRNPNDLLAMLRGSQSDAESVQSRPPEVKPNIFDLFRNSGAL